MKMKLAINIGTTDAKALGLEETKEGSIVDVDTTIAEQLIARGWATSADPSTASPPKATLIAEKKAAVDDKHTHIGTAKKE